VFAKVAVESCSSSAVVDDSPAAFSSDDDDDDDDTIVLVFRCGKTTNAEVAATKHAIIRRTSSSGSTVITAKIVRCPKDEFMAQQSVSCLSRERLLDL